MKKLLRFLVAIFGVVYILIIVGGAMIICTPIIWIQDDPDYSELEYFIHQALSNKVFDWIRFK